MTENEATLTKTWQSLTKLLHLCFRTKQQHWQSRCDLDVSPCSPGPTAREGKRNQETEQTEGGGKAEGGKGREREEGSKGENAGSIANRSLPGPEAQQSP